jgi:antagonist of KipI
VTAIRVVKPGLQTTIQDLGRFGLAHLGVSPCGAADSLSFRASNRLLGNPDSAAGLEMTILGADIEFEHDTVFALAGCEFQASLNGRAVPFWRATNAGVGERLEIGPAREGARCYLCIAGGFDVPEVLGSRSTDVRAGFGGLEGRALRRGDRLIAGRCVGPPSAIDAAHLQRFLRGPVIRVIANADTAPLCADEYRVRPDSNRLGLRLSGLPVVTEHCELLTEGVALGAVQLPPDGQPIILFVDQQTTGGYAKLAHVISADLPKVGQLRPGDRVRFRTVDLTTAQEALWQQERELRSTCGPAQSDTLASR